jgi:cellulose synthase/poly-beta-1,6-N-acetylglucosamine synthase-like glycosyltransferase
MTLLEVGFWSCLACVLYAYLGYPLLLATLAHCFGRPVRRGAGHPRSVSIVVCAHNEEASIDRRLEELSALVKASGLRGEVVLVSDGSTDATATLARAHTKGPVRLLELPTQRGKAAALSAGCAAAVGEILVFADVRQTWAPDALDRLLENFADPAVGAASGALILARAPGLLAGVGLYWRYEKWLRRQESRFYAVVGATGAISAVRRELFRPIPAGTILDDVYWPLRVALQGYRVILDPSARAYDRLPETAGDEFRRKVRTLSGNLQLLARLPAALAPWRSPVWFQFLSHKLLRLAVPWALLFLLAASALPAGAAYRAAFWAQVAGYALAAAGLCFRAWSRVRPLAVAGSFLVLNAAAWLAFWVWLCGHTHRSWAKVTYRKDEG